MPTIQLLSDIHLEKHRDGGQEFLAALDPSGVDILVLAGDICAVRHLHEVLTFFCDRYPQVVFVCGNHGFYNSSVDNVLKKLAKVDAKLPNFTWLNNKMAVVDGLRFVGGTLWFPLPPKGIYEDRMRINDFHLIEGFEPWVYEDHAQCVGVLQDLAHTADVVVTHHVPATACVSVRFGEALNHYFVHDMTDLIKKARPPLWLFGHSHDRFNVRIGETRLVANPLGYPWEQEDLRRGTYTDKLVIEAKPR